MKRITFSVTILIVFAFVGGCQTTGSGQTTYNYFYTPADHMNEMLEINNLARADFIYRDQRDFFVGSDNEDTDTKKSGSNESAKVSEAEKALEKFTDAIEAENKSETQQAIRSINALDDWPTGPENWTAFKEALKSANEALDSYKGFTVYESEERLPSDFVALEQTKDRLEKKIKSSALSLFEEFDLTGTGTFFDLYPLTDGLENLLKNNQQKVVSKLSDMDAASISNFKKTYSRWLGEDFDTQIAEMHFSKLLGDEERADFPKILNAAIQTKRVGLNLTKIDSVNVAAIEVTSRTLLEQGQIEFPIAIENDLPFDLQRADLDEAFQSPLAKNADVVVLIDVAAARNNREIVNAQQTSSEFQSGTKTVPNPSYATAQNEINNAQLGVQRAAMNSASTNAQYCYGMGCLGKAIAQIAAAAAEAGAQDQLKSAMSKLQSTPMQLTKPVYSKYKFRKVTMNASKEASVNFYVIDRLKKRYLKSNFDAIEKKAFNVAYNIHEDDRYRSRHLSQSDREDDVVKFESAEVTVKLSDLLDEFASQQSQTQRLPSISSIRKEVLRDKNKALADFKSNQFDVSPDKNDPRFDSVVVVYHPGGGLGTGFYVRDDLIITNYHVIEGSQFVEMKLFDGQETFGKVIAHDIRLDLALIKSQARGKPVSFYSKNSLPQGKTVEVIGHPEGLEFSISRGIVSSLREISSRYVPGGKKVRFIQTDAAINPGNSGGPMFLKEQVVGVNTQKLAATELEGLSFAIHYADVMKFLKENAVNPGS